VPTVVALGIDDHLRIKDARKLVGGDPSEPYLSLAVFDDAEYSEIEPGCAPLVAELTPTTIDVSGLGTFQGDSPVVFASVILTEELRILHSLVHKAFPGFRNRPYYDPGVWVPHITMRMCEDHRAAEAVFARLLPHSLRGRHTSSALLLISLPPVSIERRYELSGRT
jgi:hypothetical protein